MSEDVKVKDLFDIAQNLIARGYGDYVVTCNDEYSLTLDNNEIHISEHYMTVDFGGQDNINKR